MPSGRKGRNPTRADTSRGARHTFWERCKERKRSMNAAERNLQESRGTEGSKGVRRSEKENLMLSIGRLIVVLTSTPRCAQAGVSHAGGMRAAHNARGVHRGRPCPALFHHASPMCLPLQCELGGSKRQPLWPSPAHKTMLSPKPFRRARITVCMGVAVAFVARRYAP